MKVPQSIHRIPLSFAALVCVGLAAGFVWSGVLHAPFVFDDIRNIVGNESIRSLSPLRHAFIPPADSGLADRPLINFSLALNYAVSGLEPWSYRLLNIIVHVAAGWVLFLLAMVSARALFGEGNERSYFLPALLLALLWLVHPLQTQAVTYVIQRCESFMGLFYLCTLYCAARRRFSSRPGAWSGASVVFFFLGVCSKGIIVTAPFAVLLYEYAFFRNEPVKSIGRSKGMYLGYAAGLGLLAVLAAGFGSPAAETYEHSFGPLGYFLTQTQVVFHYLQLVVFPADLTFDYLAGAGSLLGTAPYFIALVLLLAIMVYVFRQDAAAGFVGFWFFLVLLPSSSFIPISDFIVEHRLYLSTAGPIALVVLGGRYLLREGLLGRTPLLIVGLIVLCALGILAKGRNQDYMTSESLWRDTVEKRPLNFRAHAGLARALAEQGKYSEAAEHYRISLRIYPKQSQVHADLALALSETGEFTLARRHGLDALELDPDSAGALNNLGLIAMQQGDIAGAVEYFRRAVEVAPDSVEYATNYGSALIDAGRPEQALIVLQDALDRSPHETRILNNLGLVRMYSGETEAAQSLFNQALEIDPSFTPALFNLGRIAQEQGNLIRALHFYKQAAGTAPKNAAIPNRIAALLIRTENFQDAELYLRLALDADPDMVPALFNLGLVHYNLQRPEQASQVFERVVELDPEYAKAYYYLGLIDFQKNEVEAAAEYLEQALELDPGNRDAEDLLLLIRP